MSQTIDDVLLGTPTSHREESSGTSGVGREEGEGEGDKFVRQLFESLLLGTRASNSIPDGEGQEVCCYFLVSKGQEFFGFLLVSESQDFFFFFWLHVFWRVVLSKIW